MGISEGLNPKWISGGASSGGFIPRYNKWLTDGARSSFTTDYEIVSNSLLLTLNGVILTPEVDYRLHTDNKGFDLLMYHDEVDWILEARYQS